MLWGGLVKSMSTFLMEPLGRVVLFHLTHHMYLPQTSTVTWMKLLHDTLVCMAVQGIVRGMKVSSAFESSGPSSWHLPPVSVAWSYQEYYFLLPRMGYWYWYLPIVRLPPALNSPVSTDTQFSSQGWKPDSSIGRRVRWPWDQTVPSQSVTAKLIKSYWY